MKLAQVRIVGTGLIGTSIALGLARLGVKIDITDSDPVHERLARDLLEGSLASGAPDLVVIATPPNSIFQVLQEEFRTYPDAMFIDVGSVKTELLVQVEQLPALAKRFLGTHPMAGRESGGARSAQSDLFNGRAWIVTPTSVTEGRVRETFSELARCLGAIEYEMGGREHDDLMASISHLPQVLSTALAESLQSSSRLDLAGQGLRDMVRIAASDPKLWSEILLANKRSIIDAIERFSTKLSELKKSIEQNDEEEINSHFVNGAKERARVSGKHGAQPRNYVELLIVIEDRPGQLSALFQHCAEVDANIEDLSIEHSPGQETGLISLSFSPMDAERVTTHLQSHGWKVHQA